MKTHHKVFFKNSNNLSDIDSLSIDLVVTSPPYPMIAMWDDIFSSMSPLIGELIQSDPKYAFELMHRELDHVWSELYRVVKDGGFVCINIGDSTRTINDVFRLYSNSSRIVSKMEELGFDSLPKIVWKKTSNSPNKFMGSGMLPSGAYVTLEHEYILLFRKKGKRIFKDKILKDLRRKSAFFWEERNTWFSDVWSFTGIKQKTENGESRDRTAAYPIELPIRLINMFSCYGDVVLDPFLGTGTSSLAASILGRNSIGYEIDETFLGSFNLSMLKSKKYNQDYLNKRILAHNDFVINYKNKPKHYNEIMDEPVITNQEKDIEFFLIEDIKSDGLTYIVDYKKYIKQNLF